MPRVVIHARAGFGKSEEMRHIAQKLFQEGKNAFYFELENLKSEQLKACFWDEPFERFEHWLSSDSEPAWLFLDSVDELKLTNAKLEQALSNVARSIPKTKLADIHIYLSSRPSDWSNYVEQPAFERLLPVVPEPLEKDEQLHGEQLYLEVLSGDWQGKPVEENSEQPKVQYFNLIGLNRDQIKTYVEAKLADQAQAFLTLLNEQHAWDFAACPMDLDGLIAYWRKKRELGNRLEQYRYFCEERLAKNTAGRIEPRCLSMEKALVGAEKLALSLVLTQKGSSISLEGYADGNIDILSARAVLSDWSTPEIEELLRSALFDPATHDCVQFHHRSMREYLASQCLLRLLGNHLSFPSLKAELFKQQYGEQVIPHFLKPVVAWLSVLDERFFELAIDHFPEVLMSDGSPDHYRIEQKQCLITSFAKKYATHERVMNIPLEFVARLAEPALASTLNDLWSQYRDYPDFRELVLELIEAGRISDCVDIAYEIANDTGMLASHISRAIYALEACKSDEKLSLTAKFFLEQTNQLSNKVVISSLSVLFPKYLSTYDLIVLIQVVSPTTSTEKNDLIRALQEIVLRLDPISDSASQLRSLLSKLIFEGIDESSRSFRPSSQYGYLAGVLLIICYRQFIRHVPVDEVFLWDCVLMNKLYEKRYSDQYIKVDGYAADSIKLDLTAHRKKVFLAELAFVKSFKNRTDAWRIYRDIRHSRSLLYPFQRSDWHWLLELLNSELELDDAQVVVWMLHSVWREERNATEQEKDVLQTYVIKFRLEQEFKFLFEPVKEDPREKQRIEEDQTLEREIAAQDRQQQQKYLEWREGLLIAPSEVLESEENLFKIYDWLKVYENEHSYIAWDKAALVDAFSSEVAEAAEQAFQNIWKGEHLSFWSERDRSNYFSLTDGTRLALTGLYITSQNDGWVFRLTTLEVERAIRLMLADLGIFEAALGVLYQSHPEQVKTLIANEAVAQLALLGEHPDLPLIADLSKLPRTMVSSIAAKCLPWLEQFIDQARTVHWMANSRVFDLFRFIVRSEQSDQLQQSVMLCCKWLNHNSDGYLENALFRSLLKLDEKEALKQLISRLKDYQTTDQERALKLLAGLFGNHNFEFKRDDLPELVEELSELLILAYQLVAPQQDVSHIGTYEPDLRDNAQSARNFILGSLINTPGGATYQTLLVLSELPELIHIRQHIKIWASNRAAADTEERKLSLDEVKRSFIAKEFIPNDRDSLYEAVLNKLNEVEDYLKNDDYSNVADWKAKEDEGPVQLLLSDRLKVLSQLGTQKLFSVEKEPEVFDKKKPDLRITSLNGHDRAVIELKYGNKNYTVPEFEKILEKQLIEKYLRHGSCKAGVLFISLHAPRTWRPMGKKMTFSELINHLNCKANELEKKYNYVFRLGVFGLDLTEGK